jgi:hypothetical protein
MFNYLPETPTALRRRVALEKDLPAIHMTATACFIRTGPARLF